jgi:hypothetical protein
MPEPIAQLRHGFRRMFSDLHPPVVVPRVQSPPPMPTERDILTLVRATCCTTEEAIDALLANRGDTSAAVIDLMSDHNGFSVFR